LNTQEATTQHADLREEQSTEQRGGVLQVGSLVRVTGYGPFRGLRGTIRTVDTISADLQEPFCFYLVALVGAHIKEPIWFEYHEVEGVASP
jgi:hypothetical protein